MTLLLDPQMLVPPVDATELADATHFWIRIIRWASDTRARLGSESHALVCTHYAKFGYPNDRLDLRVPHLSREYQAALSRLLSRVLVHDADCEDRAFEPTYVGGEDAYLALQWDISGTSSAEDPVLGIGTSPEDWSDATASVVSVSPTPPPQLELCFDAGATLAAEQDESVRNYFDGFRLHLVGGRPDSNVLATIAETTGLSEGDISWIPCEKAKPPRNLDERWGGLRPTQDITICITGRVGHATSGKAKVAATKAGVTHLQVESANDVCGALRQLAARSTEPRDS